MRNFEREIPKLRELKERGVSRYVIVTNIAGTGSLEAGTRDKAVEWIAENLPLPTIVWWRDDVDTRLAGDADLIFRFSLFTGIDSVRAVLESRYQSQYSDSAPFRRNERPAWVLAFLNFVATQYETDSKLRFEQADIDSSPLLELFIDVPLTLPRDRSKRDTEALVQAIDSLKRSTVTAAEDPFQHIDYYSQDEDSHADTERYLHEDDDERRAHAADFLLSAGPIPNRLVIEAAPGQGKSTLAQYVCQVHRIRMLDEQNDLAKIPANHRNAPLRVPIRIEFTHLALWFAGKSPWTLREVSHDPNYVASLESFIAANIHHASGGMACTVDDVVSILSRTPVFICLDGLDEVPDLKIRASIIDAIEQSFSRLTALGADFQVLVTSRPAIFVKAPVFSSGFAYLDLASLNPTLIRKYSESWLAVRRMPTGQASQFREVLDESLTHSHVAELARNPMQLAILLSLILTKGRSLPDQRTELYEQYMTAYLDREAIKDEAVRENRKLLIRLHGYLAWILHSRSEIESTMLSDEELRELIEQFLIERERPVGLIDQLFKGTERFFLLVSRLQGTYEFEVRPIQEFFAAHHLYKTANRSTNASPAQGSRPDRLKALLRNPYWVNVVRFYCGWYDEGELADLTRHLQDLCADDEYRFLLHPRAVASSILRDYTTAESPRDTRELVSLMCDDLGMRLLIEAGNIGTPLPPDSGKEFVARELRGILPKRKPAEQRQKLCSALTLYNSSKSLCQWWMELEGNEILSRAHWLRLGSQADIISGIPLEDALRIFRPDATDRLDWIRCVEAGRFDVAFSDDRRLARFIEAMGDGFSQITGTRNWDAGPLWLLPINMRPYRFIEARKGAPLRPTLIESPPPKFRGCSSDTVGSLLELLNVSALIRHDADSLNFPSTIRPVVDTGNAILGDCWAVWRLALIGATSPGLSVKRSTSFRDGSISPLERARKARLSSGDIDFWTDAVNPTPSSRGLRLAVCSSLLAWAQPEVLSLILPSLAAWWYDLTAYDLRQIADTTESIIEVSGVGRSAPRRISRKEIGKFFDLPMSMCCLLIHLRTDEEAVELLARNIRAACDHDPTELLRPQHGSIVAEMLTREEVTRGITAHADVATSYSHITEPMVFDYFLMYRGPEFLNHSFSTKTLNAMRSILAKPAEYPLTIVRQAESALSHYLYSRIEPLSNTASRELWFDSYRGGVGL